MERRDTQINDKKYSMMLPPVRKAMPLCTRAAVLIGPVLGTLAKDIKAGGMDQFKEAIANVDPDKIDALFMSAVAISSLTCEDQSINAAIDFDRHFEVHRSEVYQVCLWVVWETVKDFFPQLGNLNQKMTGFLGKMESQSQRDGQTTTG